MSVTTVIGDEGQIVIPAELRAAAGFRENDTIEVEVTAVGLLLRAHTPRDPSQEWFWTAEWQAKERVADAQIAAGGGERFMNGDQFVQALARWHIAAKQAGDADL